MAATARIRVSSGFLFWAAQSELNLYGPVPMRFDCKSEQAEQSKAFAAPQWGARSVLMATRALAETSITSEPSLARRRGRHPAITEKEPQNRAFNSAFAPKHTIDA